MGETKIARISTDRETTFATSQAYTWLDQRGIRGSFDFGLLEEQFEDETVLPRLHEQNQMRRGSKFGSKLSWDQYLDGLATPLNAAGSFASPQNNVAEILKSAFGGSNGGAGSTVQAGTTTSVVNVGVGHGVRFKVGGPIGVTRDNGLVECRRIIQIAADAITLDMQLTAVPANGNVVLNGEFFFLDEDGFGTDNQTLAVRLLGRGSGDQYIARGVAPKVTFEMALSGLLKMGVEGAVTDWIKTSGETLAGASYATGQGAMVPKTAEIQWAAAQTTVTTVAKNILSADEFSIDPGLSVDPERALDGIQTVKRWRQLESNVRAKFSVRSYRNHDEFWTQFATETTLRSFGIQIGNTTGPSGTGIVYFKLPCTEYVAGGPKRTDKGGFTKVDVELRGREDQAATGGTEDERKSAIMVAVM